MRDLRAFAKELSIKDLLEDTQKGRYEKGIDKISSILQSMLKLLAAYCEYRKGSTCNPTRDKERSLKSY